MKTRKTLKKRGTSKKYNKTQFRRFGKSNYNYFHLAYNN